MVLKIRMVFPWVGRTVTERSHKGAFDIQTLFCVLIGMVMGVFNL